VLARASGVELLGELESSGYRRTPSLVRRADGQTIQLTPLLYQLLEDIDGDRGYDELAASLSAKCGRLATEDDARFLVEQKLRPLGLLRLADGSEPPVRKANPLLALRLRFVVTNPEVTRRVTGPFAALFRPQVVVAVLVAFAVMTLWLLLEKGLASAAHQAFYTPSWLLAVVALTLLSAGFHEFGHAAACRYGGAVPGVMGFGLYLVWPAFYTEVSDSYRLGRRGRLRVDLGGLYFNAVLALVVFAVWAVTDQDALLLVVLTQLLQMLRQLTPFIRADGYHIVADLTGVPDLFAHIRPTLLSMLPNRWGRPENKVLKPWARLVVTAWILLVVPTLGAFLVLAVVLLPRIVTTAYDSVGIQYGLLRTSWSGGDIPSVLVALLSMLTLAVFVFSVCYLLGRIAIRTSRRAWRSTEGRPLPRALATLAAAGVVTGLAWAWWPGGQYEPIRSDDRGTLALAEEPRTRQAEFEDHAKVERPPARTAQRPALVLVPRLAPGASPGTALPPPVAIVPPASRAAGAGPDWPEDSSGNRPTTPGGAAVPGPAWPFPFSPPPPVRPGDNRAIAVNTVDGSVLYEVAFALVWAADGPVDQRNEAYALANCRDCRTVSVAFQVVLVLGTVDVVTPVNAAVAANYDCTRCTTYAIAAQLVATLTSAPSEEVKEELTRVFSALQQLGDRIALLPPEQITSELNAVKAAILHILENAEPAVDDSGISEDGNTSGDGTQAPTPDASLAGTEPSSSSQPAPEPSPSPAPVATATPEADASPPAIPVDTAAPEGQPSPSPTSVDTAAPEAPPSPTVEPSPSPS
jgi:putative peptide zinc metalloprotease protein